MFYFSYLFKKALLEDEIARQEAVEKKEQKEKSISEDDLQWDQGNVFSIFFLHFSIEMIIL